MLKFLYAAAAASAVLAASPAIADGGTRADSHAPIGVMGDHYHHKGEWMLSWRYMTMAMKGNLDGSHGIDPDTIVTTAPNRYFGNPMQPPTLRVVPLQMDMDMHMLGAMYAPSDRVTLMAMATFLDLSMDHVTYQGAAGTNVLGGFSTSASGLGDASLSALVSIVEHEHSRLHIIAGLSLPTGSTDETGQVLTPMNTTPDLRLPYPMQLGSGTWDPIVGATYAVFGERWSAGGQWRSTLRFADNDEDYHRGSEHRVTAWASYLWDSAVSTSLRLEHYRRGNVSGIDPQIVAPVQTADPDRQHVARTDIAFGVNLAGSGSLGGWRLALEYAIPVRQSVDGPQLETDSQLTLGIQKSY